jgi:hypothetical protein
MVVYGIGIEIERFRKSSEDSPLTKGDIRGLFQSSTYSPSWVKRGLGGVTPYQCTQAKACCYRKHRGKLP